MPSQGGGQAEGGGGGGGGGSFKGNRVEESSCAGGANYVRMGVDGCDFFRMHENPVFLSGIGVQGVPKDLWFRV